MINIKKQELNELVSTIVTHNDRKSLRRSLINGIEIFIDNHYALKNMESSSRIIHSQPTEGFCYWIKHFDHTQWEVAEAIQDSIYDKIMFRCTNGGRIDPKYVSDWKREPILMPKG